MGLVRRFTVLLLPCMETREMVNLDTIREQVMNFSLVEKYKIFSGGYFSLIVTSKFNGIKLIWNISSR